MQSKLVIEADKEDLKEIFAETIQGVIEDKVYNRFHNSFVDGKTVAKIHNISPITLTNYVKEGLLIPENSGRVLKFRLSEVLKLDLTKIKYKRRN